MQKHRKQLEEMEQEREQIERDVQAVEDSISTIQNEHQYLQLKLEVSDYSLIKVIERQEGKQDGRGQHNAPEVT